MIDVAVLAVVATMSLANGNEVRIVMRMPLTTTREMCEEVASYMRLEIKVKKRTLEWDYKSAIRRHDATCVQL